MRCCAVALACLMGVAVAEMWLPLADYVSSCFLIVRAETVVEEDGRLSFRVRESWKGEYDPALFEERTQDGRFFARRGEHGVEVEHGQEIVFFFTRVRDGKLAPHSTAFPIRDGKVVYASTSEIGLKEELTVAEFRRRVTKFTQPEADTEDLRYRLRIVHMERNAAGELSVQSIFEPLDRDAHADLLLEEAVRARPGPLVPGQGTLPWDGSFAVYNDSRTVIVRRIAVGTEQKRLPVLEIECHLVHVKKWKDLVFAKLGPGDPAPLHCGPFEVFFSGEKEQCVVGIAALAKHEEEHRAFRTSVPLRLVNHRWALGALRLADAAGTPLTLGAGGGSGGSTAGHFHPARGAVAYPVTLRLLLPLQYDVEARIFRFEDVALPPIDKGR